MYLSCGDSVQTDCWFSGPAAVVFMGLHCFLGLEPLLYGSYGFLFLGLLHYVTGLYPQVAFLEGVCVGGEGDFPRSWVWKCLIIYSLTGSLALYRLLEGKQFSFRTLKTLLRCFSAPRVTVREQCGFGHVSFIWPHPWPPIIHRFHHLFSVFHAPPVFTSSLPVIHHHNRSLMPPHNFLASLSVCCAYLAKPQLWRSILPHPLTGWLNVSLCLNPCRENIHLFLQLLL